MAQGPKELISRFANEVDAFENLIDNALQGKTVVKGGSIEIRTPNGGLTDDHLKALRIRYINAGWEELVRNDKWVGASKDEGRTEKYLVFKTKA